MCVEFVRFSEDAGKRVALFKAKRETEGGVGGERNRRWRLKLKIPEAHVTKRWEERVRNSRPEMPNYTIRIGDVVNDTALPGLSFDAENKEISVQWRDMFCAFFREQERFAVLRKRWQDHLARDMQKLEHGEPIPHQDLHQPWAATELDIRKQIRRARLREWYEEKGNEELVWAVDSLKFYEKNKKEDGRVLKSLGEIPGAGLGEKWFGSTYWVQALHLDETDCFHRIDVKVEHWKHGGGGNEGAARKLPQQRARSMSIASTITVS